MTERPIVPFGLVKTAFGPKRVDPRSLTPEGYKLLNTHVPDSQGLWDDLDAVEAVMAEEERTGKAIPDSAFEPGGVYVKKPVHTEKLPGMINALRRTLGAGGTRDHYSPYKKILSVRRGDGGIGSIYITHGMSEEEERAHVAEMSEKLRNYTGEKTAAYPMQYQQPVQVVPAGPTWGLAGMAGTVGGASMLGHGGGKMLAGTLQKSVEKGLMTADEAAQLASRLPKWGRVGGALVALPAAMKAFNMFSQAPLPTTGTGSWPRKVFGPNLG